MYHSRKKGFTMVELVIVIAVIAILAAILIPTFTNLIRKANEASALANARNAANQLLANLLARGDDAKDLVIFNQKGDDIYVYGYSAEAGRVLTYYGNPVDAKSIDGETLEDKAKKLLEKMLANGELTLRTPRPTETDWWHPSKMEEVVTGLNFKPEEMVLRADYKIVLARFEKGGQPEHTCTAADLDEIAEVKPTCMTQGYPAYWVCRVCGRAYHNADATWPVSADDPLEPTDIDSNAHQLGAWQHDESKHWQVCALNPEHPHLNEAAHTGNPCTVCGYSTGGNTPTNPTEPDEPRVIRITGVAAWTTEADHKDDNGNTIGNTSLLSDYGVTMTGVSRSFHTMTITYTIPEDTPANAKIILEQPTNIKSQLFSVIAPSQSFGITYKIINNSGNTYENIGAIFNSNLVENIVKTDSIVKLDNGKWICVLNDGTYAELASDARPFITTGGPFAEYVTWLNKASKTIHTSVTNAFITEYYNTHSNTEGQRFIDFVSTLPDSSTDSTVTTKANVYEKMSGGAGNTTSYRHVEGEVIKQMILFQQKSMIGYAFVENKYDANDKMSGWKAVDYKTYLSGKSADENGNYSPIVDWDNLTQSSLKVTSAVDLLESGANLVYKTNGNTTTAGAALIWHGFAGNAWQSTEICDFPVITITMEP